LCQWFVTTTNSSTFLSSLLGATFWFVHSSEVLRFHHDEKWQRLLRGLQDGISHRKWRDYPLNHVYLILDYFQVSCAFSELGIASMAVVVETFSHD
ncbi:MAG TPA: hypothetical protein VFM35_10905, partial [Candidatus Binatia bacterium]|nr:hypothetical protein [Candidatus Binatia bacterium]